MVDKKINESKNKDGTKKVGTLSKYMKAPFIVLCMARDLYVRSIIDCSGRARCGPSSKSQFQVVLPKSLSTSSSKSTILYTDEDLRDLIRAASTRTLNKVNNMKLEIPDGRYGYYRNGSRNIARSLTSGIGRIDEDKTCEFGEDVRVDVRVNTLYPRSRSEAVVARRR